MSTNTRRNIDAKSDATTFNVKLFNVEDAQKVRAYVESLNGETFVYRSPANAERAAIRRERDVLRKHVSTAAMKGDVEALKVAQAALNAFAIANNMDV